MSIKKNILFFVTLFPIVVFSSCSSGKKEVVNCEIIGTVEDNSYTHGIVYLKDVNGSMVLDSAYVKDGTFEFKNLEKDSIYAALLVLMSSPDDIFPSFLPIIIEPGELIATMGPNSVCISGTPLNENMQNFLEELDRFTTQSYKDSISLDESRQKFVDFLTTQINLNKDNIVSKYIRQAYASRLIKTDSTSFEF